MRPASKLEKNLTLLCVVFAVSGAFAFGLLVLGWGLDPPAHTSTFPFPWPWVINLFWLLLFGVQHSVMARRRFKDFWVRYLPPHLERPAYIALSGVVLLGLAGAWQAVGGEALWRWPLYLVLIPVAAALGMIAIVTRLHVEDMFGVRQVWSYREAKAERLLIVGPYRLVRHPLMACLLVFLWTQPVMTPTLALLAAGMTVYVGVGIQLEEREMILRFGSPYADYRRRVPALLPWRPAVPPAIHDAEAAG